MLLSDTVGFIRDLPHSLVASFKATLEEARQADLLLHVADASNPHVTEQIASVYKVLEELDINEKDTLLVLNQIDAVEDPTTIEMLVQRYPSAIPISARTGEGISRLAAAVSDALTHHFLDVDIDLDVANGRLLAYLAKHGEILSRTYSEDRVSVHCRMPRKYLMPIPSRQAKIRLRLTGEELDRNGDGHLLNGDGHHRNGESISDVA